MTRLSLSQGLHGLHGLARAKHLLDETGNGKGKVRTGLGSELASEAKVITKE